MVALRRAATALAALATLGLAVLSGSAHAQTILYATRAAFNAAFPGLPIEGFEAGNVAPNGIVAMGINTLDKTTNNAFFSTGSILDGLRLNTVNSGGGPGGPLDLAGGAQSFSAGDGTKTIVVDTGNDNLDVVLYNNTAHEVGFDLGGNQTAGTYAVSVFNGATLLRSDNFVTSSGAFQFVGYSNAVQTITRVNINAPVFETIDNVAFNGSIFPTATPEPGALGLLAGLGVSGAGLALKRRLRK
jgi:hypothetical protein